MWTVNEELENAIRTLRLPESELRRCDDEEARLVIKKAMETFVKDNPRSWWLSLKTPYTSYSDDELDNYKHLEKYIPNNEIRCWFVAENDEADLPAFEGTIEAIKKLLSECCFFEYYLISKNFDWLIIENDHNEIIVTHKA